MDGVHGSIRTDELVDICVSAVAFRCIDSAECTAGHYAVHMWLSINASIARTGKNVSFQQVEYVAHFWYLQFHHLSAQYTFHWIGEGIAITSYVLGRSKFFILRAGVAGGGHGFANSAKTLHHLPCAVVGSIYCLNADRVLHRVGLLRPTDEKSAID